MSSSIRRLTQHSLVYGLGHVLARSVSFLLLPLHTNYLSGEDYGVASLLFAYLGFMTIVYGFGFDSAFLRYYVLAKDVAEKKQTFSTAVWSIFVAAAILSALQIGLAQTLSKYLLTKAEHAYLIQLCAGILFLDVMSVVPFLLLRAEERSLLFASQKVLNVVLNFGLNYVLVVGLARGLNGVFEANLISSGFTCLALMPVSLKRLIPEVPRFMFKKLLAFGLPYLPSTFAVVVIDIQDRFILRALTDLETVGLYSAGYRLGMVMSLVIAAFRFAWVPFFLSVSEQPQARFIYARVLTYFTTACAAIFLLVALFIDDLVRLHLGDFTLFGSEYWRATVVVPPILFAYFLFGLHLNFLVGIHLKEKTAILPIITGVGALLNTAMNFLLIPVIGLMGAAWSTVFAYAAIAVATYWYAQKQLYIKYEILKIIQVLVLAAMIFLAHEVFALSLFVRIALVGIVFPGALLVLGIVDWKRVKIKGQKEKDRPTELELPQK